jgi:hypothetical protein
VKFRRLGRELNGINGYNLYVIKYWSTSKSR